MHRSLLNRTRWSITLTACLLARIVPASPQEPVNPDSLAIQDFQKRIDGYMKLRKAAAAQVPRLKTTGAPEKISEHEKSLAGRIREARPDAPQGNIFTPEIQAEFRRLIGLAMRTPTDAARIEKSLKRAEPVRVKLRVNDAYPTSVPLQSTPPSLLLSLPKLPPELEYRIDGHDLVIRDMEANLVVDFIAGAIP
jgi:hypothetical protein